MAQLALFEDERKQLDADKRYWQPGLESLETELTTEHGPPRRNYLPPP